MGAHAIGDSCPGLKPTGSTRIGKGTCTVLPWLGTPSKLTTDSSVRVPGAVAIAVAVCIALSVTACTAPGRDVDASPSGNGFPSSTAPVDPATLRPVPGVTGDDDLRGAGDPVLPEVSVATLSGDRATDEPTAGERFNIQLTWLLADSAMRKELNWLADYDWFSPDGTLNHEPADRGLELMRDNDLYVGLVYVPESDPAPYVVSTVEGDTVTTGLFFWSGRSGWVYARVVSSWSGSVWSCDDLQAAGGPSRMQVQDDWISRYSDVRFDQLRRARIGSE